MFASYATTLLAVEVVVQARFNVQFNLRKFPFDSQMLKMTLVAYWYVVEGIYALVSLNADRSRQTLTAHLKLIVLLQANQKTAAVHEGRCEQGQFRRAGD